MKEEEDIKAAHEKLNFCRVRESVLSTLQLVQPIVCDQYDLDNMYKAGILEKNENLVCRRCFAMKRKMYIPKLPVRRKAPYVALLGQMVRGCSCYA